MSWDISCSQRVRRAALISSTTRRPSAQRGALVRAAAKRAGDSTAELAVEAGTDPEAPRHSLTKPSTGFRFHDLCHQSITEMAEAGVPEAAMQSIAGHLSKKMLDHYSHVRLAAKRRAMEVLGRLIVPEPDARQAKG